MSRCDWTTAGEEDKIVALTNILAVTYHVGGEVVLDTVPQDLVCPVPAATEDDPGDLMVGGDSASSRHLNIVLLHCDRADLPTQTFVNTSSMSRESWGSTLFLLTTSLKSSLSMK